MFTCGGHPLHMTNQCSSLSRLLLNVRWPRSYSTCEPCHHPGTVPNSSNLSLPASAVISAVFQGRAAPVKTSCPTECLLLGTLNSPCKRTFGPFVTRHFPSPTEFRQGRSESMASPETAPSIELCERCFSFVRPSARLSCRTARHAIQRSRLLLKGFPIGKLAIYSDRTSRAQNGTCRRLHLSKLSVPSAPPHTELFRAVPLCRGRRTWIELSLAAGLQP